MDTTDTEVQLRRLAELIATSPHNLVSRSARDELRSRHIPESVALARQLPLSERALRLLDVGSGGGLPGLVIAIVRSDLQFELLEARLKKVTFLRDAISELGLTVDVHHGRAEDLIASELGGAFDLVTARAVAPLDRLLPWTIPFLRPGGLLFAVKGARWAQELDDAQESLSRLGATVIETPMEPNDDTMTEPRILVVARSSPQKYI
jgi:16S rRNA (guanine527-N7)-methyltransferase